MKIKIEPLVRPEYLTVYRTFKSLNNVLTEWEILTNLAYLNCLNDGWVELVDGFIKDELGSLGVSFRLETKDEAQYLTMNDETTIQHQDGTNELVMTARDRDPKTLAMLKFQDVDKITYTLPYHRSDFILNTRLLTDVILTDAKLKKCTDIHFDTESNFDGTFKFVVNFRRGIYLEPQKAYPLNELMLESIIKDMLLNRSGVMHKMSYLSYKSSIRFRLIDENFPARCQVSRSIAGLTLVIRLFDFSQAPEISKLGFRKPTMDMLNKMSKTTNGLTLVSGIFGSGKGTTLNAVGMKMEEEGKLAIVSLDDPIEYLRKYNQFEYSNEEQLQEYVDAFKKMDLNCVYLNEVIVPPVAEAVFNLVSAGVHVLTTIHVNRVFRIMYKLEELLGNKYLNIIPFINVISYQDKFSICCEHCRAGLSVDSYEEDTDEFKFLNFLGITDVFKQPEGCSHCEGGVNKTGIKVISEHIEFSDEIKNNLITKNIHEQFMYLKEVVAQGESMEKVVADSLREGSILLSEAMVKLDTWR